MKVKFFLFFLLFTVLSCVGDNEVVYPFDKRVDNIRDNLNNGLIDFFEAYMQAYEELRLNPGKDADDFLNEVLARMDQELKRLYELGEYEKAVIMADSLTAAGYENITYSVKECYDDFLKYTIENKDKFTVNELKNRMIIKKLLGVNEVFDVLKKYYDDKSAGLFFYYLDEYSKIYPELLRVKPQFVNMGAELREHRNMDFEGMMEAVVTVYLDKGLKIKGGMGYQDKAIGTGFFIDNNGHILTNHHVIADHVDPSYKGPTKLTVALRDDPATEIPARVVGYDKVHDIALLKVERYSGAHLTPGRSHNMKTGDKIYTIGNPIGLRYTVTSGIISNREINFFQMGRAFQVDAAINPGNSGGPLIDDFGQVVGIVFAGVPQFQGISFAIPFEWVRQTIPLLYRGGMVERTWIGAGLYEDRDAGNLLFYYILPGSGADMAGIKVDDKLLAVNGIKVKTLEEAQSIIAFERNPSIINIEILRDGKKINLPVKTSERPYLPVERAFAKDTQSNVAGLVFGLRLSMLTRMLGARSYKVERIYKGLAAYSLDISDGDPVMIYGIRFLEKEKVVVMQIRYMDKEVASMERIFTIQVPAEINTII